MANAVADYKVVRTIRSLTLELNEDEVNTLLVILAKVGGDPYKSPRKHAASIGDAIDQALGSLSNYRTCPQYELLDPRWTGIYFLEGK